MVVIELCGSLLFFPRDDAEIVRLHPSQAVSTDQYHGGMNGYQR
jgi:hypothetical protein